MDRNARDNIKIYIYKIMIYEKKGVLRCQARYRQKHVLVVVLSYAHTLIPHAIHSICQFHTSSGCGEKKAHINWSMVTCQGSTRYWNYLEDYWPCAGGLSAVNAIGTQSRDPIKGTDPMAYGGLN